MTLHKGGRWCHAAEVSALSIWGRGGGLGLPVTSVPCVGAYVCVHTRTETHFLPHRGTAPECSQSSLSLLLPPSNLLFLFFFFLAGKFFSLFRALESPDDSLEMLNAELHTCLTNPESQFQRVGFI